MFPKCFLLSPPAVYTAVENLSWRLAYSYENNEKKNAMTQEEGRVVREGKSAAMVNVTFVKVSMITLEQGADISSLSKWARKRESGGGRERHIGQKKTAKEIQNFHNILIDQCAEYRPVECLSLTSKAQGPHITDNFKMVGLNCAGRVEFFRGYGFRNTALRNF